MGDGTNIVERRDSFEELVHAEREIRFSSHLAYLLLDRIDVALGSTPASPLQSYRTLSWLAGAVFALSLVCLAGAEHWSPRAIRYIALAILAPATLDVLRLPRSGYWSYQPLPSRLWRAIFTREAISRWASSRAPSCTDSAPPCMALAIWVSWVCALRSWPPTSQSDAASSLATALSAVAVGAALIWLWNYIAVLGLSVIPYHAIDGAIWRRVWEAREAESRIIHPLLSTIAARDLFASGLVAGLSVLPVVLANQQAVVA